VKLVCLEMIIKQPNRSTRVHRADDAV